MIKTVIRLRNDDVMVFDVLGEAMPEYQGRYAEVRERILRDSPAETTFCHWFDLGAEPEAVDKARW